LEDIIGSDKHRRRDRDIWRIRCFAVDDELEFVGLFDRKIRWLDTPENLVDVITGTADVFWSRLQPLID
jgi:hypothetical protein